MPQRIQLSRKKGWRMPPNCVKVDRTTKWGNPFTVAEYGVELAVKNFRLRAVGWLQIDPEAFAALRGKDLACWCPIGSPCHADVLIELANEEPTPCQ